MSFQANGPVSILFPYYEDTTYKTLGSIAFHDLGLDTVVSDLTDDAKERVLITGILSNITSDPRVAEYRREVFSDFMKFPQMRAELMEILDKISFLKNYVSVKRDRDEKLGMWDLMHRLDEINEYITYIESMRDRLGSYDIRSEGLISLRKYIDDVYNDSCFAEMKKDISMLKRETSGIQSVTVGINLNERFEASSLGLISVNDRQFKKSNIVSNFSDAISNRSRIHQGTDWDGDMHYQEVDRTNVRSNLLENTANIMAATSTPFMDGRIRSTLVNATMDNGTESSTFYLDKVVSRLLDTLLKKLRETLSRYSDVAVISITKLIPEFVYYIKFAEFIEKHMKRGLPFCEPELITAADDAGTTLDAKGLFNLKLGMSTEDPSGIVLNDLRFDREHTVYVLTGANRGGKTTVTQAVGQLFVLAQGGIYVPCRKMSCRCVDNIFTHFPADEDKTLDLGRLGEECVRFRELYSEATGESLILLNETFSTTSFEEGYYIARDSLRAILKKGVRTIYNTHMHKLATDIDSMNGEYGEKKAASLVMKNDGSRRSFTVEVRRPDGMSYAHDIAEKYGVTYDMLTGEGSDIP